MDDGLGPVSFVLGERQKDGSTAVRIAALADEFQPLRIAPRVDETRAILGLVGSSMLLHVKTYAQSGPYPLLQHQTKVLGLPTPRAGSALWSPSWPVLRAGLGTGPRTLVTPVLAR